MICIPEQELGGDAVRGCPCGREVKLELGSSYVSGQRVRKVLAGETLPRKVPGWHETFDFPWQIAELLGQGLLGHGLVWGKEESV